ncbi:hypothetical protein SAMN05192539_104852 [Paraburkholderia diazotrophica]|uniref:Uncharacterized protein n=1 Tax=Paraburkholderia diazotrophica TaxID=667676 RepID=A0A1H7EAH7_9BURK|nr:hypothetical protein SAMN05192539_104852 [Paraburkholderia diazotrophica]
MPGYIFPHVEATFYGGPCASTFEWLNGFRFGRVLDGENAQAHSRSQRAPDFCALAVIVRRATSRHLYSGRAMLLLR